MPRKPTVDWRSERAQDAIEYLLVTGGVAVAFAVALLTFDAVIVEVAGHVCPSVDTANALAAVGSCLGMS
jgi:hypothetical protein